MADENQSQVGKFKQAARELDMDNDLVCFKERLAKMVKHKPVQKP